MKRQTMYCGLDVGGLERARARDYLEDEVAQAFFAARECEAYYLSLKSVDHKRGFHGELEMALVDSSRWRRVMASA
jgi:hypothetical protein